jgi:hypothetical protein
MDAGRIHTYGFVLWFLPALFWSKNIVIFLKKIFKNDFIVFIIGLILWFLLINRKEIWYFGLDKAMISIIWVALGKLTRTNIQKIQFNWLMIVIWGLLLALLPIPGLDMAYKVAFRPVLNVIYAFGIIMEIIFILKKINGIILPILGKNSMLIYVIHPYINNLAYVFVILNYKNSWWLEFIVSMICLFVILWIRNVGQKTKYANLVNWV